MTLPNLISTARVLMVPAVMALILAGFHGHERWAAAVYLVAALSDSLDGYLARRQGWITVTGAFLDPLADKLLLIASFVTLTWLKALPFWITAVVFSRDVMLIVGALLIHMVGGRIYPHPTWAGKAATFFQILTVLTALLSRYYRVPLGTSVIVWLAAGFTIASGLHYIWQGVHVLNAAEHEESDEAPLLR